MPEYPLTQELPRFIQTDVTSSVSVLTERGLFVNMSRIQTRVALLSLQSRWMLATVWNLKINIKKWNRWGCQEACHEKLANLFLNWNHCACLEGQGSACSRHSSSLSFIHHRSLSLQLLSTLFLLDWPPGSLLVPVPMFLSLALSCFHGLKHWLEQWFCRKLSQAWEYCEKCFNLESKISFFN